MSDRVGFFTREETKHAGKKKRGKDAAPVDYFHRLGLSGVKNMNPRAVTPNMAPRGSKSADVYVLGGRPSKADDEAGSPFRASSADELRKLARGAHSVRWGYCVPTLPVLAAKTQSRKPTVQQTECYRPQVSKDIAKTKPRVLVLVGQEALSWALPKLSGGIKVAFGRMFPVNVGGHTCWAFPVLDPQFVAVIGKRKEDDVSGDEWERTHTSVLKQAFTLKTAHLRPPEVWDPTLKEMGITLVTKFKQLEKALAPFNHCKRLSVDIETTCLRPYTEGAKILTASVSADGLTVAFPLEHPGSGWSKDERKKAHQMFAYLLRTIKDELVVQNGAMELEWFLYEYGDQLASALPIEDTYVAAYTVDSRQGGLNLNYLTRLAGGFSLKAESQVDIKNLAGTPLKTVLLYNALDSKYTDRVWSYFMEQLIVKGLWKVYTDGIAKVMPLVRAQWLGLPVSQKVVRKFAVEFGKDRKLIEAKIARLKTVRKFEKTLGRPFNPASNDDVAIVLRDICGRKEGRKAGGKYSVDAAVLKTIDLPIATLIVDHRSICKLKGTYVDRYDIRSADTYVYPDGLLHCHFNACQTATRRLSSSDPNNQNWPKRKHKEVRKMIKALKGYMILASDYGQIEARVIGMLSRDKAFCKALWENYDVHLEWAERIIKVYQRVFKERGKDIKSFRSEVKNEFVFPLFFGSSWRSVGRSLTLPDRVAQGLVEEFWDVFKGVAKWQKKVVAGYHKNGYVETATGFRRAGPLSYNMQINTPVQGTASDIVMAGMIALSDLSIQLEMPWLQPVLNVHDDLTFMIPIKRFDEAVPLIAAEMTKCRFDFINVPLVIEMEKGCDWFEMKEFTTFSSAQKI